MSSKRLTILLPLLVVAAMLASLLTPATVLAAGEPPPPPGEKTSKQPISAQPAPNRRLQTPATAPRRHWRRRMARQPPRR